MSIEYDVLLRSGIALFRSAVVKGGGALEEALSHLDFLLTGEDMDLFLEALTLLDSSKVTRVKCYPSQRIFWQVGHQLKKRDELEESAWSSNGLFPSISGGSPSYTVLTDGPGLCTCTSFREHLDMGSMQRLCPHLLAAVLGDACGEISGSVQRVKYKDVGDEEGVRILERSLCPPPLPSG